MSKASAKTRARVKARQTTSEASSLASVNQHRSMNKNKHSGWEMSAQDALNINFVDSEISTQIDE